MVVTVWYDALYVCSIMSISFATPGREWCMEMRIKICVAAFLWHVHSGKSRKKMKIYPSSLVIYNYLVQPYVIYDIKYLT